MLTAHLRYLLAIVASIALTASPTDAQLELPDHPRTGRTEPARGGAARGAGASTRGTPSGAEADPTGRAASDTTPTSPEERLEGLVRQLLDLREFGDARAGVLAGRILSEEEGGRVALLRVLADDHPVATVAAARELLGQGRQENFPIVAARLRERMPTRAVVPMLEAVRSADPVRGGPALLVGLLDHPQSAMRHAAREQLGPNVGADVLPHLVAVLGSRRSETRLSAILVAAQIDDPSVLHLLIDRLSDSSAKVAAEAARLLAGSTDARSGDALRDAALGAAALTASEQRRSAYALLALTEREESTGQPQLGEDQVEGLLELLRSSHPAQKGAGAIALAGVGFRSERPDQTPWLDLEVPHELVKIASGAEFHSDFSSLQGPATLRLARIAGVSFGSDGPAWQAWWTRAAGSFHARRAVLRATPEAAAGLRLTVEAGPASDPWSFQLLGPAAEADPNGPAPLYLTELEARDLVGALRRQGVLSSERLPGLRGPSEQLEQRLTLELAGQVKEFRLRGTSGSEPWFVASLDFARALAERNGWQRYFDPSEHPSQRDLWLAERDWWAAERPAVERARRRVERILHWWGQPSEASSLQSRQAALAELELLYSDAAVRAESDFSALVACIASGAELDDAERLVALAFAAVPDTSVVQGQELLHAVLDTFGEQGDALTRRVLSSAPPQVAHAASVDSRSHLRAVSASTLVAAPDAQSRERFRALFDDSVPSVQVAAAQAAGATGDETWRAVLVERAASEEPEVAASALRAAAYFGGEQTRSLLLKGLNSSHLVVSVAAAEGLADLADPTTVPVLISLLAEGPDSPFFLPGRRGLLRLRGAAWPDLMRTVHAGRGRVRRDAAFVLSEQGVADVASTLLGWLTDAPGDAVIAQELAVLTCTDMRSASDPASAWWEWWDLVVHDDSIAWMKAGLERERIESAPLEEYRVPQSEAAALSLVAALEAKDEALAERARRELAGIIGPDAAAPPAPGVTRTEWLRALRSAVEQVFAERRRVETDGE